MVKYIVILADGMADLPLEEHQNKTPMELAKKPNMDFLARRGKIGMVKTVPDVLPPGSDVANLSCMGYNPLECYTGRSPLEAASIGIELKKSDLAFRCNLVTLTDEESYRDKTMADYCAGDISTEEAAQLIEAVEQNLSTDRIHFYSGVSYRHCMVMSDMSDIYGTLTPPHDISDRKITDYITDNAQILSLMEKSFEILSSHPVNQERIKKGKRPANSIWLWGQGKRASIKDFYATRGIKGAVISAVDLIKGIGISANMKACEVEGATGYIDTNFSGKAKRAVEELKGGQDFVYLHIEAPDECGHRGETENKIRAIEMIDEKVIGYVRKELDCFDDYKIMVLPDHPTPLSTKTHSSDPVPYLIYQKSKERDNGTEVFSEKTATQNGDIITEGYKIMDVFLGKQG